MKIGFLGCGGTGKSTTAKEVAKQLDLPLMISPSRSCFQKHGILTEDAQASLTPEERFNLQMDIFQAIDDQVSNQPFGVFERTHLDNLFYALQHSQEYMSEERTHYCKQQTLKGLRSFNLIFRFPLYRWNIPSDGMRTNIYAQRYMMDQFIAGFLMQNLIPYYTMANIPPTERVEQIVNQARSY